MSRSASQILDLDDPAVFRGYDERSVARGLRYASQGRVEVLDIGTHHATGHVQGTDVRPYEVDIDWSRFASAGIIDVCSCPLGGACKHAVALIAEVAQVSSPRAPSGGAARTAASSSERSAFGPEPFATEPFETEPFGTGRRTGWRDLLSDLLDDDPTGTPLALQFTLERARPTSYNPDPPIEVHARPMRTGAKGRWIKSGAGWREVLAGYSWDLRAADPAHLAAIKAVGAASEHGSYSTNNGMMDLGRFGFGLWAQLRQATEAGVALLDAGGHERVTLSDLRARTVVDLTATDDGGIALIVGFEHDGTPLDPTDDMVAVIGSPPHGFAVDRGHRLELISLERPVNATLAPLVGKPSLHVPAIDVDDFLDDVEPRLGRVASVRSSDGSVTAEPSVLEGLVAGVDHNTVGTASLRWFARYRRGNKVTDHLLAYPHGAGRDRVVEQALVQELELPVDLLPGVVDILGRPANMTVSGHTTVILLTEVVPWLQQRGQVVVEVSGDAPGLREADHDPLIELDVFEPAEDDDERTDWFDLSVSVTVDGEQVVLAELFRALVAEEPVLLLPSGTWVRLDHPELTRLRELLAEARGLAEPGDGDTVKINRFQSSWWEELASIGVVQHQALRWREAVAGMAGLTAPEPVPPPAAIDATLRGYQQEGLDWLVFLHRNRLGGILADDMGLGKTVQSLALFLQIAEERPGARFLVVAPTSVVENWHREAARFAPSLSVATIAQTATRRGCELESAVGDARVVVTSYALFRLEFDDYQRLDWEVLVLDEAQFVKNHRSKTYQCVRRLDAAMKVAITGTPIENSLMDLWSLLSITAPGLYPDPTRFSDVYRRPIENGSAPERLAVLRRRIAPLMRRRTKDQVLSELPPKTEQTIDVELSARHMRIYESQLQLERQKLLGLVGDVDKNRFEILKSLTTLRQLSLDPGLVDSQHAEVGSAKLDRLVDDLTQVVAEGHRALVFSQFTRYLNLARDRLDGADISYAYLDGRTRRRDLAIAEFKDGDVPVFLISLKAGGFGLNLTEADYCFVLDPWWNPATETQAVDRTHRIGQHKPVMVYRYVSTGTIEEKVMALKERKAALFDNVIDAGGALAGALQADDIRALIDLAAP